MSYLIEILLPTSGNMNRRASLDRVRAELTETFGGVTLHVNAPAEGLWNDSGEIDHDRIVVIEVMVDVLDRSWWGTYRAELEGRFEQDQIVVRATDIERL
jgi:streptogramin lyase